MMTISSSGAMEAGYPRRAGVRRRFATMPTRSMASQDSLSLTTRAPEGSRAARRLRREGLVPGVIYGGDSGPEHFAVDGRILRNTLAHAGAILQVSIDGAGE